jgi:chromosome segregation ATPase|tara:strand:- start:225 stop:1244 length:1020 start_codon:yes stop_codon:yes gene_type:complete
MKINSFYDKDSADKSNRLKITASGVQNVVDTSTITRLESELENLKQKLELAEGNLSIATTQHLKEKEQFSIAKQISKEAIVEVSKIQEHNELLKLNNQVLTDSLKDRDTTIGTLKSEVHRLTPLANNYAEAQNNYTSTKNDLERFTETSRLLSDEKKLLVTQVSDLEGYTQSIKTDLKTMKEQYNSMSNTLSKVNGDNAKLRKELNEAHRNTQTWKSGFATLEEENANLTGLKNNLTTWLEQIQGEASNLTGKSSLQDKELQKTKQTIVDMGKTVDDLFDTNSYLRECNNKYLTELNKPRYASIGAISRQEGFRFPTQFIAPKNSLGSGKPTLLKVRKM